MSYEWDENEFSLAYLLTFRTYGTWHHGDERGAVDRSGHNTYGAAKMPVSPRLAEKERGAQKSPPFELDEEMRSVVDAAIRDVCVHRDINLFAFNVRTNHAHAVVSALGRPEKIMEAFKSYSTRALRAHELVRRDIKIWSRHGSMRYLWKDRSLTATIDYVLYSQGDEFPNFEELVG